MSDAAVKLLREVAKAQESTRDCFPALDDILLFALERQYLGIGQIADLIVEQQQQITAASISNRLREQVRLFQIQEMGFERGAPLHLAAVESVLASMRECGHSLLFVVEGNHDKVRVFFGIAQFVSEPSLPLVDAADGYAAAWKAHFPGTSLTPVLFDDTKELSARIAQAKSCCALTGIPALKREERDHLFVQGLERLVRALRGRSYVWVSIADPADPKLVDSAIEACQRLNTDIHTLVKTSLSRSIGTSKTAMAGG